jgi:hypothetical protein
MVSIGVLSISKGNALTGRGRLNLIHPSGFPTSVKSTTWTNVCNASKVTGASIPLRADFEIKVTETAQLEWNNTVKATFVRDGDGVSDIFVIDGLVLQASEPPRDTASFTYKVWSHSYHSAPMFISPLSTHIADRRDDQGEPVD